MLKKLVTCFLGVAICTAFIGCSGEPAGDIAGKTVEELNQANSKEALKKRLLEVAESGEAGSSLAGLRESLEDLKKSDSSISDELLTLCGQLESAGSSSKIKSIAKKMAGLL